MTRPVASPDIPALTIHTVPSHACVGAVLVSIRTSDRQAKGGVLLLRDADLRALPAAIEQMLADETGGHG